MFPVTRYTLAKINLVKAACPYELASTAANSAQGQMIVVEKNRKRFGFIEAADYFPPIVIVAGASTRRQLIKEGYIHGWALVENGSMELSNREIFSSSELLRGLQQALLRRIYGNRIIYSGQAQPSILECCPFERRVIYAMKGGVFEQKYEAEMLGKRNIVLVGESIAACGTPMLPPVQTGLRYAYAPFKSPVSGTTQGGAQSELMTGIIRDWADIKEAVAMYLGAAGKDAESLRPRFEPVALTYKNKAGEVVYRGDTLKHSLVKAGIDPFEFAVWSADAQHSKTKKVGSGDEVPRGKFLWAPSSDPSSWKLPVPDASHVRNALARVNQTEGIPSSAKPGILNKLRKLAKHHGVKSKPTGKQKKWAAQVGTLDATV